MANGRVCTGYSFPYVALYANNEGTISYSATQALARGVSITTEVNFTDGDKFYADNVVAEEVPGTFSDGTATLTVDGLFLAAESLIYSGTATTSGDDWFDYDDGVTIPYVGIGYVARYMSAGTTSYVPYILPKCRFQFMGQSFNTQGETIDWQTQELTADIYRDDSTDHVWKKTGKEYSAEADAVAAITGFFAGTVVST